jgi:hypothetical protein
MKNFLFYKELVDGQYIVEANISKTRAMKLYKEALKDFGDVVRGTGWEQLQDPILLSQENKLKKGGLTA